MGIRFFCPECGHKMNVKTFLAGKRGICPKCDARVDIPLESTRPASAKAVEKTDVVQPATTSKAAPAAPAQFVRLLSPSRATSEVATLQ